VTGADDPQIGGHTGRLIGATIMRSYSTSRVIGENSPSGFSGSMESGSVCSGNFWDIQTSGLIPGPYSDSGCAAPRETFAMKTDLNYVAGGWDMDDVWHLDCLNDYPTLAWEGGPDSDCYDVQGSGTKTDPYLLDTCMELMLMHSNMTAYYALTADIDCSDTVNWNNGKGFMPVGYDYDNSGSIEQDEKFSGTFNGWLHNITGLLIYRPDEYYVGMFGYADEANITNFVLDSFNVSGLIYVGGIAGRMEKSNATLIGAIGNVNATGYGSDRMTYAGGFAGSIATTKINKSYVIADVYGGRYTGGFTSSMSEGSMTYDTYARGNIWASREVYGYAEVQGGGGITRAYAAMRISVTQFGLGFGSASVGTVCLGNFWDGDIAGLDTDGICAQKKTTVEMNTVSTYTDAGWDFCGAFPGIWAIDEGATYPCLDWEYEDCVCS
jgi:hypothetical protein